jgi:hypothetical protein
MRLRYRCSLGHDDMRVDIDGWRRGAAREAIGIMVAGGGAAIAILAVDHVGDLWS